MCNGSFSLVNAKYSCSSDGFSLFFSLFAPLGVQLLPPVIDGADTLRAICHHSRCSPDEELLSSAEFVADLLGSDSSESPRASSGQVWPVSKLS